MTTFPLPFRTAITIASWCTSMPIYLMSRLISVASLGGRIIRAKAYLSPKVKCHAPADLPNASPQFFLPAIYFPAAGAERSPAERSGAQAAPPTPLSIAALFP